MRKGEGCEWSVFSFFLLLTANVIYVAFRTRVQRRVYIYIYYIKYLYDLFFLDSTSRNTLCTAMELGASLFYLDPIEGECAMLSVFP